MMKSAIYIKMPQIMTNMLTNSRQKLMIQKKQVQKSGPILHLGGNKNTPGLQKIKKMVMDQIRTFYVAQKYKY